MMQKTCKQTERVTALKRVTCLVMEHKRWFNSPQAQSVIWASAKMTQLVILNFLSIHHVHDRFLPLILVFLNVDEQTMLEEDQRLKNRGGILRHVRDFTQPYHNRVGHIARSFKNKSRRQRLRDKANTFLAQTPLAKPYLEDSYSQDDEKSTEANKFLLEKWGISTAKNHPIRKLFLFKQKTDDKTRILSTNDHLICAFDK
jgi:hypothetical protein